MVALRRNAVCALPEYYAAYSGNSLPQVSVQRWISLPLKTGPIGCPETSVRNYHSTLRNIPEDRSSQTLRGLNLKSSLSFSVNAEFNFVCVAALEEASHSHFTRFVSH